MTTVETDDMIRRLRRVIFGLRGRGVLKGADHTCPLAVFRQDFRHDGPTAQWEPDKVHASILDVVGPNIDAARIETYILGGEFGLDSLARWLRLQVFGRRDLENDTVWHFERLLRALQAWEIAYLQRPTSHITERANSDTVDSTDGVAKPGDTESAIGSPTTAIHTADEQRATSLAPLSLRSRKARTNGKRRGWTGWVEGDKPTPRFPIDSDKPLVLEMSYRRTRSGREFR